MGLLSTYNSEYSWKETRKGTAFVGQHSCDQEVWQILTAISREGWTSLGRDQHSAYEWCSYKQVSGPTLSTASESLQCNPVLNGPPETLRNGLDAPSPAAWRFSGKLKGKILMGHWHQKVYQWQVVDLIRINASTKHQGRGAKHQGEDLVCRGSKLILLDIGVQRLVPSWRNTWRSIGDWGLRQSSKGPQNPWETLSSHVH